MASEPVRLGEISLDLSEISPRWDENLPYEHFIPLKWDLFSSFFHLISSFDWLINEIEQRNDWRMNASKMEHLERWN